MAGRSGDDGTDDFGTLADGTVPGVDDAAGREDDGDGGQGNDEDDVGSVFGPRDEPRSIEPGDPSLEHALFVLLGVLTGVASMLALLGVV